jgi:3D (Asp-Asp-Asp) domain-containing protein
MKNTRIKSYISIVSVTVAAVVLFAIPSSSVAESNSVTPVAVVQDGRAASIDQSADQTADKPDAPDYTVNAKADGRSHIKIKWSKVKDADGYTVYRSSDPDKRGEKIYTTEKASKKSYKDKEASIDESYWYTVSAWKNTDGEKLTVATIKSDKVKNSLKYKSTFTVKTYAYSGGGTTASGKKAQVGRVAVDPRVIELGTWLYVEDYGLCQAADTGGAIKGNKVDLYMDSESECYEWGVRHKDVYILE